MKKSTINLTLMLAALLLASCHDHSYPGTPEEQRKGMANTFDFSTVQDVNLTVDYSAAAAGAVFFSIYAENPMTDDTEPVVKKDAQPVFQAYTDASGVFREAVRLPAYATRLYVYTGNFFVGDELLTCDVQNGTARVAAAADNATTRGIAPFTRAAEQTTSLETLYQLTNIVDWRTGDDTGTAIYKAWQTPLGSWDAGSGRPSYIISENTEDYTRLAFTSEEMTGIMQAISGALTNKQACSQEYRLSEDMVMKKDGEVAVTVVGTNSCWNSSLGYYYYTDKPNDRKDLNIIMLFPNTQDGKSSFIKSKGNNYNGNIGLQRGDVVQLMYYPNIANGDYSNATKVFPKGTRVGFILKSNGWGMQKTVGDKKYYNSYKGDLKGSEIGRQYNAWASSTDGMSYCHADAEQNQADPGTYGIANPNGEGRVAKFAYENAEGQQYAIISFEDACNDDDYDDLILALKPIDTFEKLPTPEPRKTSASGVYAFEDLWPARGDYDLNDAVIDYAQQWLWSAAEVGADYKIVKETVSLTPYLNYVTLQSGLAVTIDSKATPTAVSMKTVKDGVATAKQFAKDGNTYLLTDNISATAGTQFVIELEYSDGIKQDKASTVKPFIYRNEGDNGRWEVHIPFEKPTDKMIMSYFDTQDDCSDVDKGNYYVRAGNYPFAFFLSGVSVNVFKNTLLLRENESKPIDELYPFFLDWAVSKGATNKDWYLKPADNN